MLEVMTTWPGEDISEGGTCLPAIHTCSPDIQLSIAAAPQNHFSSLSNQSTLRTDGSAFFVSPVDKTRTGSARKDCDYPMRGILNGQRPATLPDVFGVPYIRKHSFATCHFSFPPPLTNCCEKLYRQSWPTALFRTQSKRLHCIGRHERCVRGSTAIIKPFLCPTAATPHPPLIIERIKWCRKGERMTPEGKGIRGFKGAWIALTKRARTIDGGERLQSWEIFGKSLFTATWNLLTH